MAERAAVVVPALSKVFFQAAPDTSWLAAEALALIVFFNGNNDALGALVSGTAPERPISVRRHAVDALGLLGKRGLRVQPLLRKLLVEKDTQLRKAAVMALLKQRGEALPVVPDLLEMLRQDSELADCLEMAIEIITGKPSPISRPRKSGVKVNDLGRAAYDSPMYQRGWTINIISGNPPAKQPADTPSKQEEKGKQG